MFAVETGTAAAVVVVVVATAKNIVLPLSLRFSLVVQSDTEFCGHSLRHLSHGFGYELQRIKHPIRSRFRISITEYTCLSPRCVRCLKAETLPLFVVHSELAIADMILKYRARRYEFFCSVFLMAMLEWYRGSASFISKISGDQAWHVYPESYVHFRGKIHKSLS
jgi:hypothetical protein